VLLKVEAPPGLLPPSLTYEVPGFATPPLKPTLPVFLTPEKQEKITAAGAADALMRELRKGRIEDPSQLRSPLQSVPGGTVPLTALREVVPLELRVVMKDGVSCRDALQHRTDLVEVSGPPGQEQVVFTGPCQSRRTTFAFDPKAPEFVPSANFMFDPNACEFELGGAEVSYPETEMEGPLPSFESAFEGIVDEYCLKPAAAAMPCLNGCENLTVAEPAEMLANDRIAEFGDCDVDIAPFFEASFRPPPGLFGEAADEWRADPVEVVQTYGNVLHGGLNPEAAEFRPMMPLAEYAQVRKLGSAKAVHNKASCALKPGFPDAMPEDETMTYSEETASGEDEPFTSDFTTSWDEEEIVQTANRIP